MVTCPQNSFHLAKRKLGPHETGTPSPGRPRSALCLCTGPSGAFPEVQPHGAGRAPGSPPPPSAPPSASCLQAPVGRGRPGGVPSFSSVSVSGLLGCCSCHSRHLRVLAVFFAWAGSAQARAEGTPVQVRSCGVTGHTPPPPPPWAGLQQGSIQGSGQGRASGEPEEGD